MTGTDARLRIGSAGEHELQRRLGTEDRAARFYERQLRPYLTQQMREFIARQTMVFLATADGSGACDASFRAGPPGFVQVLDDHTLVYPEYRGNGVMASAGNITENPHLGLLFVDFSGDRIGLHVNGTAQLRPDAALRTAYPELPQETAPGRRAELWVRLSVDEAYLHCSKHIPHLLPASQGTRPRSQRPKDPDYFTGPVLAPQTTTEPTRAEPSRFEPARLEPARLERAHPAPARREPGQPAPVAPPPGQPALVQPAPLLPVPASAARGPSWARRPAAVARASWRQMRRQ